MQQIPDVIGRPDVAMSSRSGSGWGGFGDRAWQRQLPRRTSYRRRLVGSFIPLGSTAPGILERHSFCLIWQLCEHAFVYADVASRYGPIDVLTRLAAIRKRKGHQQAGVCHVALEGGRVLAQHKPRAWLGCRIADVCDTRVRKSEERLFVRPHARSFSQRAERELLFVFGELARDFVEDQRHAVLAPMHN